MIGDPCDDCAWFDRCGPELLCVRATPDVLPPHELELAARLTGPAERPAGATTALPRAGGADPAGPADPERT